MVRFGLQHCFFFFNRSKRLNGATASEMPCVPETVTSEQNEKMLDATQKVPNCRIIY